MSDAKKIVRLLAIQLAPQRIELVPFYEDELVKAGLADLLEAGQAMRDCNTRHLNRWNVDAQWDTALAKVKGRSA